MRTPLHLSAFCVCLMISISAPAQTSIDIVTTTNSLGIQHDLFLDFTGEYTGSQLLVELTAGSIVVAPTGALPLGGETSFLSLGGDSVTNSPSPNIGGGAIDIPGNEANSDPIFSATLINQAWSVAGGGAVSGATDFLNARLTTTPDAFGFVTYLVSVDGEFTTLSFPIPIPEPTTAALLGLAGLSFAGRRRCTPLTNTDPLVRGR